MIEREHSMKLIAILQGECGMKVVDRGEAYKEVGSGYVIITARITE